MARRYRLAPDEYPSSDGKPIAETPFHMRVMAYQIYALGAWFRSDPRVYVGGNLFVYYVPGDRRKRVTPDVMVAKGVDRDKRRDVFKVWEGRTAPCVVIEATSRKTRRTDEQSKFVLYQDVLKVHEYFLFDPLREYLDPPLKGFRLWRDRYRPIRPVAGRLPSVELGLHLEQRGADVRLWDLDTSHLLYGSYSECWLNGDVTYKDLCN